MHLKQLTQQVTLMHRALTLLSEEQKNTNVPAGPRL